MKRFLLICLFFALSTTSATGNNSYLRSFGAAIKKSPPYAEISKFDNTKEIPNSQIPEVYDESPLRIGSMAKYIVEDSRGEGPSVMKMELRDIKSNSAGKIYVVETSYTIDSRESNIITISDAPILRRADFTNLDGGEYSRTENANVKYAIHIEKVVLFGLAGLAELLDSIEISKKATSRLKEQLDSKRRKIEKFSFVGNEDVTIDNKSIPCKIYEIQSISKNFVVFKKGEAGRPFIERSFTREWICDKVPFGRVRSQSKVLAYIEDNKPPMEYNYNFRVTSFQY